ncbi:hypothetical protein [uncultured Methanospirillum sp.]|uniref:hypothetical protein n=1 Tax=uncultured Methanospirillum sp. TaxID=262503 RepID=UPI0029C7C298|nr:hypothetical protein [uncultured Methanospirillum sp.]
MSIGSRSRSRLFLSRYFPVYRGPWAGYEIDSSSGWGASSEAASDIGLVEFFSPASCMEGDLPRSGRETQTSTAALLIMYPAGTTEDFFDVPDDSRGWFLPATSGDTSG